MSKLFSRRYTWIGLAVVVASFGWAIFLVWGAFHPEGLGWLIRDGVIPVAGAGLIGICLSLVLAAIFFNDLHRIHLLVRDGGGESVLRLGEFWSFVRLANVVCLAVLVYFDALVQQLPILRWWTVGYGVLLALSCNYYGKLIPNQSFGIRNDSTRGDYEVWWKAHRLMGRLGVAAGFAICGLSLVGSDSLRLALLGTVVVSLHIVSNWYSRIAFRFGKASKGTDVGVHTGPGPSEWSMIARIVGVSVFVATAICVSPWMGFRSFAARGVVLSPLAEKTMGPFWLVGINRAQIAPDDMYGQALASFRDRLTADGVDVGDDAAVQPFSTAPRTPGDEQRFAWGRAIDHATYMRLKERGKPYCYLAVRRQRFLAIRIEYFRRKSRIGSIAGSFVGSLERNAAICRLGQRALEMGKHATCFIQLSDRRPGAESALAYTILVPLEQSKN